MKYLILLFFTFATFSPIFSQKSIKFDQLTAKNISYEESNENVVSITYDSTSSSHFYLNIRYSENDSARIRFFTKKKTINLEQLNILEEKKKILRDGLCTFIDKNEKSTYPYRMGYIEGESTIYKDSILYSKIMYSKDTILLQQYFYPNGNLRVNVKHIKFSRKKINNKSVDINNEYMTEYYENGKLKREEEYDEDLNIIHQKHYTPEGKETTFYTPLKRMAQFPGGDEAFIQFVRKNLRYPPKAIAQNITGRVILRITVEADGKISKIKVTKSLSPETDQEAIRVAKLMPDWIPGIFLGELAPYYFSLPVRFTLDNLYY